MHGAGLPEVPQDGAEAQSCCGSPVSAPAGHGRTQRGRAWVSVQATGLGSDCVRPPPGSLVVLIPGASRVAVTPGDAWCVDPCLAPHTVCFVPRPLASGSLLSQTPGSHCPLQLDTLAAVLDGALASALAARCFPAPLTGNSGPSLPPPCTARTQLWQPRPWAGVREGPC